jgi:hypothetical protein
MPPPLWIRTLACCSAGSMRVGRTAIGLNNPECRKPFFPLPCLSGSALDRSVENVFCANPSLKLKNEMLAVLRSTDCITKVLCL